MGMREAAKKRTLCEVLREICDMHQGDSEHNRIVRQKLVEAETMGKRMSAKLIEYNKQVFSGWWLRNKDYEVDLKRRLEKKYCTL